MATLESVLGVALSVDIEKRYPAGETIRASFTIPGSPPRVSILFGPSGAGKTTILRCLAGLEPVTRGRIRHGDEMWVDAETGLFLPPQKRSVGYLFQDYALFPHLDVGRNVGYGLGGLPHAERAARVEATCSMLGLDGLVDRKPAQLSGGQQQRVALARVLVRQPELLLLDEPFSSLDAGTREEVRSELAHLLRRLSIPALVVTHDWVDALTLGDEMIVISQGRILQVGSPREVLTKPCHPEVAAAVGVETVAVGQILGKEGGVVTLQVGMSRLVAVDPGGGERDFYVCIRGEDVTLERGRSSQSSARNHLRGRVTNVVPTGVLTKVFLDVGFELVALVTRQAADDLKLSHGREVWAAFKASNVHLIERPGTEPIGGRRPNCPVPSH